MPYRRGDIVSFARGSNEYEGEVVRIYKAIAALEVHAERIGGVRVSMRDVKRIVRPVLTVKEIAVLGTLARVGKFANIHVLHDAQADLSASSLVGLARRGLASQSRAGVVSGGAALWGLTEEGKRVARDL